MAEVALAGLVEEGVSGVGCMARNLFPGAVLALDAVAAQMAPLNTGFVTLDPGHLGDLGQSSSLGICSTGHPGGHGAVDGRSSSWFSHSVAAGEKQKVQTIVGTYILMLKKGSKSEVWSK